MYHDAYTIQLVEDRHLITFNFVGGMVPFLLNLILDVSVVELVTSMTPCIIVYIWERVPKDCKHLFPIVQDLEALDSFTKALLLTTGYRDHFNLASYFLAAQHSLGVTV